MNPTYILGISAFYHDSAAAIIKDGEIIAAAQEERFSRNKHDSSFPKSAIQFCLKQSGIKIDECKAVVYYEKPLLVFKRIVSNFISTSPRGGRSFIHAMKIWIGGKIYLKDILKTELALLYSLNTSRLPEILFTKHHQSHAAAAFYPSPFKEAVILCMDGVGEWATTSTWIGNNNEIKPLWEISFPHSLGLLYSAFTHYCGFKVNSGEYKLMGLAPYGEPKYIQKIKDNLIDIKDDGTFRLEISYFKYHRGFQMTSRKFHKLFEESPRTSKKELTQFHMDLAASIQVITEEIVIKIAKSLKKETGLKKLCLSGGVALNCVANGKLIEEKIFDDIWIQPASGDAGSALGAALACWYQYFKKQRTINEEDSMKGSYLGPSYSNDQIHSYLKDIGAEYQLLSDDELTTTISKLLNEGKIIGWFNGRMEFGPRALGGRSIIGDPRNKKMQSIMNMKIKFRESFRPFAPSILEEDVSSYFNTNRKNPYMLIVSSVIDQIKLTMSHSEMKLFGIDKLKVPKSIIPAVTHVDYSTRVQTVNMKTNPRFYNLISKFKESTGCKCLINTSFNVRGEPIVCSPQDAFRCFMRTEMDALALENYLLIKKNQIKKNLKENWNQDFKED